MDGRQDDLTLHRGLARLRIGQRVSHVVGPQPGIATSIELSTSIISISAAQQAQAPGGSGPARVR
jgi:hypothetical protein